MYSLLTGTHNLPSSEESYNNNNNDLYSANSSELLTCHAYFINKDNILLISLFHMYTLTHSPHKKLQTKTYSYKKTMAVTFYYYVLCGIFITIR